MTCPRPLHIPLHCIFNFWWPTWCSLLICPCNTQLSAFSLSFSRLRDLWTYCRHFFPRWHLACNTLRHWKLNSCRSFVLLSAQLPTLDVYCPLRWIEENAVPPDATNSSPLHVLNYSLSSLFLHVLHFHTSFSPKYVHRKRRFLCTFCMMTL